MDPLQKRLASSPKDHPRAPTTAQKCHDSHHLCLLDSGMGGKWPQNYISRACRMSTIPETREAGQAQGLQQQGTRSHHCPPASLTGIQMCLDIWDVLTGPVLMHLACSLQSPFLPSAHRSMGSQT